MKTLILLLTFLLLPGCSTLSSLLNTASEANDNALLAAEVTICRAASIGSILRRYDSDAKARAWKELCTQDNKSTPIIINNSTNE